MTAQAKDPTLAMRCLPQLVLFGIDNRGKPKAARFGKQHAGLALRAATQLQLKVLASNDPKVAEIAARLPVGRVHATGRTFVPFIRRDLYDKLVAAAANGNANPTSPPNGFSGASGSTPGGPAHMPQNWQAIGIGDLVVANQSREDGWYEAIVVEQTGDMFTLRWPSRLDPEQRHSSSHDELHNQFITILSCCQEHKVIDLQRLFRVRAALRDHSGETAGNGRWRNGCCRSKDDNAIANTLSATP